VVGLDHLRCIVNVSASDTVSGHHGAPVSVLAGTGGVEMSRPPLLLACPSETVVRAWLASRLTSIPAKRGVSIAGDSLWLLMAENCGDDNEQSQQGCDA